jgi:hypothetical protein
MQNGRKASTVGFVDEMSEHNWFLSLVEVREKIER